MNKPAPTSVRIDDDLKKWLQQRASAEHRSLANYIEHILLEYRTLQERPARKK